MTKFYEQNTRKYEQQKPQRKPDNIVLSDDSDNSIQEYECDRCHYIIKTHKKSGEIDCQHCNNYIVIEDTQKKSKIEMPKSRDDGESALVATVFAEPDNPFRRKEPELRGGFAELQKRGVKITNYYTTEKEEQ